MPRLNSTSRFGWSSVPPVGLLTVLCSHGLWLQTFDDRQNLYLEQTRDFARGMLFRWTWGEQFAVDRLQRWNESH